MITTPHDNITWLKTNELAAEGLSTVITPDDEPPQTTAAVPSIRAAAQLCANAHARAANASPILCAQLQQLVDDLPVDGNRIVVRGEHLQQRHHCHRQEHVPCR